jgi:hypothetical protein
VARKEVAQLSAEKKQKDDEENSAAIKMQSAHRGNQARKEVAQLSAEKKQKDDEENSAAIKMQSAHRGNQARKEVAQLSAEKKKKDDEENSAAIKMQSAHRGNQARKEVAQLSAEKKKQDDEENLAATKMQSNYRGRKAREEVREIHEERHSAATKLQSNYRGKQGRREHADRSAERKREDEEKYQRDHLHFEHAVSYETPKDLVAERDAVLGRLEKQEEKRIARQRKVHQEEKYLKRMGKGKGKNSRRNGGEGNDGNAEYGDNDADNYPEDEEGLEVENSEDFDRRYEDDDGDENGYDREYADGTRFVDNSDGLEESEHRQRLLAQQQNMQQQFGQQADSDSPYSQNQHTFPVTPMSRTRMQKGQLLEKMFLEMERTVRNLEREIALRDYPSPDDDAAFEADRKVRKN